MTELRRNIKCSNCGNETSVYISMEMSLNELLIHGKCQRCGNSLQINFSLVGQAAPQQTQQQTSTTNTNTESNMVNVDESLFEPEIPSDVIRDLIEE